MLNLKRKGFTLLEMLMVMSVLAFITGLASYVFFNSSMTAGNQVKALSALNCQYIKPTSDVNSRLNEMNVECYRDKNQRIVFDEDKLQKLQDIRVPVSEIECQRKLSEGELYRREGLFLYNEAGQVMAIIGQNHGDCNN